MSSDSSVYITDDYSAPMAPQHNFSNNFDLDNPVHAMSSYARIMHAHTQRQLKSATNSARRRSQNSSDASSTKSLLSVSSTGS